MDLANVERAVEAATEVGSALGLAVDDATVLRNSNKLALRLLPCEAFARVAVVGQEVFDFEIDIARRLSENGTPVASLDTRVDPRVYQRDGFAVTFWRYYEQAGMSSQQPPTRRHLSGCTRVWRTRCRCAALHRSPRGSPALVESHERSPRLGDSDRELLSWALRSRGRRVGERSRPDQLLHGEPHPGNVLTSAEVVCSSISRRVVVALSIRSRSCTGGGRRVVLRS